jgi:hypothetical protein
MRAMWRNPLRVGLPDLRSSAMVRPFLQQDETG